MSGTLAIPLSAHELRDAVRTARRFDPVRLDRVLRLDEEHGLLEVQASVPWTALAEDLGADLSGLLWDTDRVAQAVEANAPAPDGSPMVAHIEALALVTPDGELRRASRSANGELFALAVGGRGLFGALYSVTLRLPGLRRAATQPTPSEVLVLGDGGQSNGRRLDLLLPPEQLESFMAQARACCAEWRAEIKKVEVRRTTGESDTVLCWARREYAAVGFALSTPSTLGGSVRSTQLRRELIDAAISHGGSFAIDGTPEATREQALACYPGLRTLLAEKRRIDPGERLSNSWYRHHRALLEHRACEVRWNRE
jgi:hypothetical protein